MEAEQKSGKGLSRDAIKLLALFTMTLNHIAHLIDFGGCISKIFINIGYFTAVTMVYFLVEGYGYTRNRMNYSIRLAIFACLAQIPFSLAFSGYEILRFVALNMLFTLLICFLILVVHEKIQRVPLKIVLYIILIAGTWFCDWPIMAGVGTLLFIWAGKDKKKIFIAYLLFCLVFFGFTLIENGIRGELLLGFQEGALGCIAPMVSCLFITCFYNGKRAAHGRGFLKWFCYIYYPAHLLALGIFRLAVLYLRGFI